MANPNTIVLRNLRVGDSKTLSIKTTDETGTAKNPSSGWFLGLDPDRSTVITATNSGASNVQFRGAASGATNKWNSVPARVYSDTWTYDTDINISTSGAVSGLWTVNPLPVTPPTGASLKLLGYPLLKRSSATLGGNSGTIQVLPSGSNEYTAYAGDRRLCYHPDFGTDDEEVIGVHRVDPSW